MSASKTQAFILRTQDYRDTSILGDFYTKDFGKIHGIVRGVRDGRERYGSTLEPFSLNEILFYRRKRGGDLHQVTQVDLVGLFPEVRQDLERLAYASYFTELLNVLVPLEDPSPPLFDLLKDCLAFLSTQASPRRCARIYEVKLFEILGLMPEFKHCVHCRKELPEPAFFSAAAGGIHCRECGPGQKTGSAAHRYPKLAESQNTQTSLPLSRGCLNFLEHVKRSAVADLQQVKVSQEVGGEVQRILTRFVNFNLTFPLKSVTFLEKMGYN